MRFLVIEGLDGSGKSTQIDLLKDYLEDQNVKFKYLHFPRLETGLHGKLIARFLRGEMGKIDQVDPYLVALIFAGDRLDARPILEQWIAEDYLVIVDRFVYSNIAFQCAKYDDFNDRMELADWILELEFGHNKLPAPDLNIFLDVPFQFTRARLSENREGADREYLKGRKDIHEQDIQFQQNVSNVYHTICAERGDLTIINCADGSGEMKNPATIFENIRSVIKF